MGRSLRRKLIRQERIEDKKNRISVTRDELKKLRDDISNYNVDSILTCVALAELELYGFGKTRILRTLNKMDEIFGDIASGKSTIDDLKKRLIEKTSIVIKC
jgi:hypothetical protein